MTDENLKKLQTILIGGDFHAPVKLKDCHKSPTVVVIDDVMDIKPALEINGKKYRKRKQKRSSRNTSKFLVMAEIMSVGMYGMGSSSKERKRPTVNIEKEFERIQNKESELSRNDRDWVVNQFKYLYEEIIKP